MSIKTFVKTLETERVAYGMISDLSAVIAANLIQMTEGKEIYVGAHARPDAGLYSVVATDDEVFNLVHDWIASKDELEIRIVNLGMYITLK